MAIVDENRYKSNSYKSKAEAEQREVQKVTKGNVRVHQKTTGEKIKESLFGEGVDNLSDYLLFEVLIPSFKELADNFMSNAKDMILWGEVRGGNSSSRRSGRGSYVDYQNMGRSKRNTASARRARFDFSYIEYDDPDDIDEVIEEMRDIWDVYHEISVAQYYMSADPDGIKISPTDHNWGWTDIRSFIYADTRKIRERNPQTGEIETKWLLDLPKPKPLDY